ncbi:Glycolate dehydrogenase, subunit GlcD [Thermogutta terrifontis]|uniref:Glycolate dehydrogenase, subunit GlcD n=1 Tax=Thermogutta terrifontis TaxID=1331910 RepID=A0A286RF80_9BACT|nr:anaerobic glycerol-3-phosphate dehydrogenase subunit C [Thermogutta terrifontis]ASV74621.1 Glycolate dehydrogenase, subunit GlcD [Thermogutta terrifontis]
MAIEAWEQQRVRVYEDLSGLVKGRVLAEPVLLELFARDASIFHIRPLVVVRPQSTADVSACLQYCAEHRLPVHARGAGTGLAGECLGPGVVLDFSAYMRRLISVEERGRFVRVQPGVVLERLQRHLKSFGRKVAPEPFNSEVTTVGGSIAREAWTSRSLKYGLLGDYVREVTVCLADGTRVHFGQESLAEHAASPTLAPKSRLVLQVAQLLRTYEENRTIKGRPRLRSGYRLEGILADGKLNMPKLLAGSEGTLAVIVEATLETVPTLPGRAVGLLLFDKLEPAFDAALEILSFRPLACDLMDRRHLGLAREAESWFERLIPESVEAAVLIEIEGLDVEEARQELQGLIENLRTRKRLEFSARITTDESEITFLWKLARIPQPIRSLGSRKSRPLPVADDVAVPPEQLGTCVFALQHLLNKLEVSAAVYCQVSQGQIHLQPFLQESELSDAQRIRQVCDAVYEHVLSCGGNVGLGRGCGLSRSAYLARQWGPEYALLVELKRIFDPLGLLNPGKIVADSYTREWWQFLGRHVRADWTASTVAVTNSVSLEDSLDHGSTRDYGPTPERNSSSCPPIDTVPQEQQGSGATNGGTALDCVNSVEGDDSDSPPEADRPDERLPDILVSQLDWHPQAVASVVSQCTACGHCRTQGPGLRMCPLFRAQPFEEASPRAKVTLVRAILTGDLPLETITEDTFRAIADLCVHCHMCRVECPAQVDVPHLMMEAKTANTAAHGLPFSDWLLNRIEIVAAWGARVAPFVNWALQNKQLRWLLEKVTGIAQARKLPRLEKTSFLRIAARRHLHRPPRHGGPKVAYFVDVFATWFDHRLAEALIEVFEHNGIGVYVPLDQRGAGTAALTSGDADYARRVARRNVMVLAEAVRQGYDVVTTEPAAALSLTREYPEILDEEDARLVAAHTFDACDYLYRLYEAGKLRLDFQEIPLRLTYHWPCRLRALGVGQPGRQLLELIPELRVTTGPDGCSGMAGTYGLKHAHYRTSLRVGWPLLNAMRDAQVEAGVTECSTCRIQMEQATAKPTLHPIKILAVAYGLWPGGKNALLRPSQERTLAEN